MFPILPPGSYRCPFRAAVIYTANCNQERDMGIGDVFLIIMLLALVGICWHFGSTRGPE